MVDNLGQGGWGEEDTEKQGTISCFFDNKVSLFLNYITNYNAAIQLNDDHL